MQEAIYHWMGGMGFLIFYMTIFQNSGIYFLSSDFSVVKEEEPITHYTSSGNKTKWAFFRWTTFFVWMT